MGLTERDAQLSLRMMMLLVDVIGFKCEQERKKIGKRSVFVVYKHA